MVRALISYGYPLTEGHAFGFIYHNPCQLCIVSGLGVIILIGWFACVQFIVHTLFELRLSL